MIRIRSQQVEILPRRVRLLPLISVERGRLKPSGMLQVSAVGRYLGHPRQADVRALREPTPITLLDIDEELGIATIDVVRGDGCEDAASAKGVCCLGHPH